MIPYQRGFPRRKKKSAVRRAARDEMRRYRRKGKGKRLLSVLLALALLCLAAYFQRDRLLRVLGLRQEGLTEQTELVIVPAGSVPNMGLEIPPYEGELVTVMADGQPGFGPDFPRFEGCYARYSELDKLIFFVEVSNRDRILF